MHTHRNLLPLALCLGGALARGQTTPNTTATTRLQSAGFNSTFTLPKAQIAAAGLSASAVADIENIVRFDESQLAHGGVAEDAFYDLGDLYAGNGTETLEPGALLKVQEHTDASSFALPPNTALSRILYTTADLNGTVLPASAFVLWPFRPRVFPSSSSSPAETSQGHTTTTANANATGEAPVVLWSHGTSGFFAAQAPSTHRGLWYGHAAPFALAQDGYAVVAPDYGGLGVGLGFDGRAIPHQYLASRVGARDGLYALRAAHAAFPGLLAAEFVAFGHSQGGGVAWGVAEVLAEGTSEESETGKEEEGKGGEFADLKPGYRGAVAASPTTDLFTGTPRLLLPWISLFLRGVFPSFDARAWLTPLGLARTDLLQAIQGGISVSQALFLDAAEPDDSIVIEPAWNETWYVSAYGALANVGRRPFAGPLLVVHGTADAVIPLDVTTKTVRETCAALPAGAGADLEYLVVNGAGHVPVLDAARPLWLDWIRARFEGEPTRQRGCVTTELESFLPVDRYAAAGNSYLQWAGASEYAFETPLGP
ncbi:hypothetical protein F5X98DRAFT_29468 [Xylaria grammica]|nr:hypothetical protein F5X98DRAFT_29468 [Xylaria grammica]